ncbi:MAG: phosphoribosylanthranilate isomerase [Bacteroidales bacterium]|jgi:phosphoribosylanthranilate isomerase|nr:phosphoribosylanthranilate isomerase [Bacteroidales bacterium]
MIRIKICCIGSIAESQIAISFGASAIGLVGKMPSGQGPISDDLILQIVRSVPPPVATFLLTSETTIDGIIIHHQRVYTSTIQIVDKLKKGTYGEIKTKLPGIKIVQVIHVRNDRSIEEALEVSEKVDALLLDSGNPDLALKELGGTGRTHNWELSRKIVEQTKVPVFLAGGLHSGNVRKAIDLVQPFGVDVCSGVRTDEKLDRKKLEEFFKAVCG